MCVKDLEQCLACTRCDINVSRSYHHHHRSVNIILCTDHYYLSSHSRRNLTFSINLYRIFNQLKHFLKNFAVNGTTGASSVYCCATRCRRVEFLWLKSNKALWFLVWSGHIWGPQNPFRGSLGDSCFRNHAKMLFVFSLSFSLEHTVPFSRNHMHVVMSLP